MTFPKHDNYQTYGGELQDRLPSKNFHKFGATDLPTEDINQCRASLAGEMQTGFQSYIKYSSFLKQIIEYKCGWDKIKSDLPIIHEIENTGIWVVQFPDYITDLRGKKQIVNMIGGLSNPDCDNHSLMAQLIVQKKNINTFWVYATSNSGIPTETIDLFDLFFF
jgi:hypothetical protein